MKIYTIRELSHYAFHLPRLYVGAKKTMLCKFRIFTQCWYEKRGNYDINKLCGWSFGNHHKNSIRVGWRPADIPWNIDLFFYYYQEGKCGWDYFTTIKCNSLHVLNISLNEAEESVDFLIAGGVRTKIHAKIKQKKYGYYLFPYFGGTRTAPKEMYIELKMQ